MTRRLRETSGGGRTKQLSLINFQQDIGLARLLIMHLLANRGCKLKDGTLSNFSVIAN